MPTSGNCIPVGFVIIALRPGSPRATALPALGGWR